MPLHMTLFVVSAILVWASGCGQPTQKCAGEPSARLAQLRLAASALHDEVLTAISEAQRVQELEEELAVRGLSIESEETACSVIEAMILDMVKRGLAGLERLAELESRRRGQLHIDMRPE